MINLSGFLDELERYPGSDQVNNQYKNPSALSNLKAYLEYMLSQKGRRVLLVGEAPGYKGCGITGIPFTSSAVFHNIKHPLLESLERQVTFPRYEGESTATIVWNYLSDKPIVPLFWNSFPFHPHSQGNLCSNRAPDDGEIKIGTNFICKISEMYNPSAVAAIGRKGEIALKKAFPEKEIKYIRHPSYGGKPYFIAGMDDLLQS